MNFWDGIRRRAEAWVWAAPILLFVVLLGISVPLWQHFSGITDDLIRNQAESRAEEIALRLGHILNERATDLTMLGAAWSENPPELRAERFTRYATLLAERETSYQLLAVVEASGAPVAAVRSEPLDEIDLFSPRDMSALAAETDGAGEAVLARGPLHVEPGGEVLILWHRLAAAEPATPQLEEDLWLAVLVRFDSLVGRAVRPNVRRNFAIELYEGEARLVASPVEAAPCLVHLGATVRFNALGREWTVRAEPYAGADFGQLRRGSAERLAVYLVLSVLLAGCLGGALYSTRRICRGREELARRNEFIETILAHLPVGLAVHEGRTGRLLHINHRFEEVCGWPRERLGTVEAFFACLFPDPLVRGRVSAQVRADVAGGDPERMVWQDVRLSTQSGAERFVNARTIPLPSQDLLITTVEDVTERKRAQDRLDRVQKELLGQQQQQRERVEAELSKARDQLIRQARLAAVGRVSASIAHELRNPLGVVRTAAACLARRMPESQPQLVRFVGVIEEEINSAEQIIDDLMEMTRAKPIAKEDCDLDEIVCDTFERVAPGEGVRCRSDFDPQPFVVHADPLQLRQVLANLLNNALQAMPAGGTVHVSARRARGRDTIVVRDEGPGVPAEICGQLFEPLVTTKAQGTGLGLAICRQIIERHGGSIELVADNGRGAAFQIILPAAAAEAKE